MPTQAELQAAAAAAAQYTQTAEQAAMLNAAYRNNELPVVPRAASSGISQAEYEDAQNEAIKRQIAFSQPRSDVRQLSGNALAISQQYAASRNRVVTGGGVSYQGEVSRQENPYAEDTAAGIAWEVSGTGGAVDQRMGQIAEGEIREQGGDPSFIRYATDIYVERPQFEREILTTKEGQQFVNPEWHGVPIRLNLTRAEMEAGGGIAPDTYQKYLRYDDTTHLLNRLETPDARFGIDTGVHKARGDFGGPILQGGTYGGWRSPGEAGRLVGGKTVASGGSLSDVEYSEATAKQPFVSARYKPPASKEYEPSGFLGLGGLFPKVSKEQWSAYVTASKADPFGSALRMQSAMVAPAVAVAGGVASKLTFGLSEFAYKPETDEWGRFVEGSGRVARAATGMTLAKQEAYFETIKNAPGILGEAKRGVFYFGTEVVNKPAELAPAAITGFGISKAVAGAPGLLARVGEGTGLTARAARFVQTPGGTSLVKAGAAGLFGGAYTWGVTEGLSASPEKTKENIYRSGPTLAAMYGGAGGLNWVGETKFVRGGSTPTGATFSGVQIQNTYFGGGRTPSGGKYAGAFSPTESYVITGKPQPVAPRARPLELPDLRPKQSGFVDADIGGDWVKPAQLPDYATPMETRSQSAGGMYARPEAVRDMTWDRPLVERNAKGYAPSDVTKTWQTDSQFVEDKLTFIEIHGKDTLPAHLSKTIPETEHGYLSEMAKEQGHHKLFAISEGKIVGGVSYGYMELGDTFGGERYLEMYSMEAVPRGSGVGTAIVDKIEQIAMSKNVKAIEGASLETAIGFWKKMGYEHPSENKFAMYDIRKPIMQEPEPYNPLNPKRVYAEPTPISDSTKRMFEDIHISGVPDRVVQAELARINRGGLTETSGKRGMMTLIEREGAYTEIEMRAFRAPTVYADQKRNRKLAFSLSPFSRKYPELGVDPLIVPKGKTAPAPYTRKFGEYDLTTRTHTPTPTITPTTRLTTPTTPFITPTRMPTPTTFSPPSPTPTPGETPRHQPPYNPPPTRIIEPPRPPYEPPFAPPTGGWGFGGGGGSRQPGNLGVIRWQRENLIADKPYLARGIQTPDFSFKRTKRRKNPFGF